VAVAQVAHNKLLLLLVVVLVAVLERELIFLLFLALITP
jgi:hypothetical protein